MNFQMMELQLVYPPITNWEFDYLSEDAEVAEYVKRSKLYMICQRPVLRFDTKEEYFSNPNEVEFVITKSGSEDTWTVTMDIFKFIKEHYSIDEDDIIIEIEDRMVHINNTEGQLIHWFTPDKLIFDITKSNGVMEHDPARELLDYDLLYVGISKANDSFSRLSKNHHGRLKILSRAEEKTKGERITNEMVILLFDVVANKIKIYDGNSDNFFETEEESLDKMRFVADAEKAFIKLLDPEYNEQKYANYPQSTDGLHGLDIEGALYFMSEMITLRVNNTNFSGDTDIRLSDCISVKFNDNTVEITDYKGQKKY